MASLQQRKTDKSWNFQKGCSINMDTVVYLIKTVENLGPTPFLWAYNMFDEATHKMADRFIPRCCCCQMARCEIGRGENIWEPCS